MYRKLLLITIISLFLVPMVAANPFVDFFRNLFGLEEEIINIESASLIINERTECSDRECKLYVGKKFHNYNGEFYNYSSFLTNSVLANTDITYSYLDGTQITYTPVVILDGRLFSIDSLPSGTRGILEYEPTLNRDRDNSKLEIQFRKPQGLTEIGFQINSNTRIEYIDYEFTKSIISEREEKYNLTVLRIGNVTHTPFDLVEDGFNFTYDKQTDLLLINVTNFADGELINIDPSSSFFSQSNDGFWTMSNPETLCNFATDNITTGNIGDNHIISPAIVTEGAVSFDTSLLPDNATIKEVNLTIFANSYAKSTGLDTNWTVMYLSKKQSLSSPLNCPDRSLFNTAEGGLDWEETTGNKTKLIKPSSINKSGNTSFRLTAGWLHVPSGRQKIVTFRTSEFAGTNTDPVLTILTGVCSNNYNGGNFIVDSEVNCTGEQFSVDGTINITNTLYLREETNMTCNDTIGNLIYSNLGGKILFHNESKLLC